MPRTLRWKTSILLQAGTHPASAVCMISESRSTCHKILPMALCEGSCGYALGLKPNFET